MKTKLLALFFFAAVLLQGSCSGLDIEPRMAIDPKTLGQNEVQQLLTGTYRSLQSEPGRDTWVLFDMRGENLISTYLSSSNQFVLNDISPANGTVLTMWRGYYKVIDRANLVLSSLAKLEATEGNLNIAAQARYLRAYSYYCLTTRFGDVPLITEPTLDRVKLHRHATILQFVRDELKTCIDGDVLEPLSGLSGAPFLVSVEAAKALLARVALTMGDMTTAGTLAEELITSGTFELSDDYDNIFTSSSNSEVIFSLSNSSSEGAANLFAFFTTYDSPVRGSWFLCPSPESELLFEDPADLRNTTNITHLITSGGEDYIIMNKFRDYAPLIVSRIAEMYLISAEARGMAGLGRLNELRNQRGLPSIAPASEAEYADAVALERRKELYCEGFLFYDLLRTGRMSEVGSMNGKTNHYLPLPESEVKYNPDLNEYND